MVQVKRASFFETGGVAPYWLNILIKNKFTYQEKERKRNTENKEGFFQQALLEMAN
jgi:hypothetical protein